MIRFFKDAVLRFRLKNRLRILDNQPKMKISSFRSMAIILSEDDLDETFFSTLAKSLKISPKRITIVVFSSKKIENKKTGFGKRINFSKEEIGFSGGFNQEMLTFFEQKFDLLVNFFYKKSVLPELISANCSSKLRMGFSKANQNINDIVFEIKPEEKELFLSESTNYLNAFIK